MPQTACLPARNKESGQRPRKRTQIDADAQQRPQEHWHDNGCRVEGDAVDDEQRERGDGWQNEFVPACLM